MGMLRTRAAQVSLWEAVLPEEVLRLPEELARVDALLDDPVFFAPFVPFFDPRLGRPSTPMETYLRMMFLKFRYRLGYETLCREVGDSITWRRFCRIPLDGAVPHPTTLMKLTTRCGTAAVDGCNEALLAKAAQAKLLRTAGCGPTPRWWRRTWPTRPTPGCWPRRCAGSRPPAGGCRPPAVPPARACRDRSRSAGMRAHAIAAKLRLRGAQGRDEAQARCSASPASWRGWPNAPPPTRERLLATPAGRCAARRPRRSVWPPRWPRCRRRAAARAAAPGGQRPDRLVARHPPDRRADPAAAGRHHPGRGRAGGSACTTPMPVRSPRAGSASRSSSVTRPRSSTTTTALCSTTPWQGNPADAPQLAPAVERVITPHRPSPPPRHRRPRLWREECRRRPARPGRGHVVIPRKGKPGTARQAHEHRRAFRHDVKWRTGSEGRISSLKRGYGWDRTRLDGTEGARIWTGHGVLAHNLVKIGALAG